MIGEGGHVHQGAQLLTVSFGATVQYGEVRLASHPQVLVKLTKELFDSGVVDRLGFGLHSRLLIFLGMPRHISEGGLV